MLEAKRYLICTSPRTGSTLLSRALRVTGRFGMQSPQGPGGSAELLVQYWNQRYRHVDWSLKSPRDVLEDCWRTSRTPNGVEGFKIMWHDLERLCALARASGCHPNVEVSRPETYLPDDAALILLLRRDRVGQAVSWVKANQSASWNSTKTSNRKPLRYNYLMLRAAVDRANQEERRWRDWFARLGRPLPLYDYEDLLRDIQAPVDDLAAQLGVEPPAVSIAAAGVEKQSDAVNDEWRRRYERDASSALRRANAIAASVAQPEPWTRLLTRWRERRRTGSAA